MTSKSAADLRRELVAERFRGVLLKERSRARDLFSRLDTNGDGTLSKPEFVRGVRKLGLPFTPKEVSDVFASFDKAR